MPASDNLDLHIETSFSQYDVADVIYDSRPARVLYSSGTHTAQSGLAKDDNPTLLFDYMERFMELIRACKPKRILLIGGGVFVLPRAILAEFPAIEQTVVEIDAELPAIAEKYFDFQPHDNTRLVTEDGIQFLKSDEGQYDMILLDVYSDEAIPSGFQTERTAKLLRNHLTLHGVVACNIIAAYHGQRSATLRRQVASFQAAFKNLQLFPAGYDESPWLPQNFILTAQLRQRDLTKHFRYSPMPLPGA